MAEPGLLAHQKIQRLINLVFCIFLTEPQKSLHLSDLFFIFAHVGSGDVSKAFSKFPVGIYIPQERVALWQVFWKLLQGIEPQLRGAQQSEPHPPGCLDLSEPPWQPQQRQQFPSSSRVCPSASGLGFFISSSPATLTALRFIHTLELRDWFPHRNFAKEKVGSCAH